METPTIRRIVITAVVVTAALTSVPAWGQPPFRSFYPSDNTVRIRGGLFTPEGEEEYWEDKRLDFTGEPEDFEDAFFGADYIRYLAPNFGLLVTGSVFEGEEAQSYLDFVDEAGGNISHTTSLDLATLQLGLVVVPVPRDWPILPYFGAGGGFYSWRLTESGDFIDFAPFPPEIFNSTFEDDGVAQGYFFLAGFEVPLGQNWALFAEGRWERAEDDLGGDDFEGFGTLDLSGRQVGAGLAWYF
jgi:hypothetical protein